jgi:hypothetical protein
VIQELITKEGLIRTALTFPPNVRESKTLVRWYMCSVILKYYLGKDWLLANVAQDDEGSQPPGFFRLDFSTDIQRELKTARALELAEMMFNLQHAAGFQERMKQLRTGQFEATFAELDTARFLHMHDLDFKFVIPSGVKGKDYDYEITYSDDCVVCADTKCRIEGQELRPETIETTLNHARRQNLPKKEPGVIFLKVPPAAYADPNNREAIPRVVNKFLAGTGRIVSVVVYSTLTEYDSSSQMIRHSHSFDEFANNKHRFDMSKNWRLFVEGRVKKRWSGMPEKWVQLFSVEL